MKKAMTLLLALALVLGLLTACGGNSDSSNSSAQGAESSETQGEEGSETQGEEGSETQGGEGSETQGEEGSETQGEEGSETQGEGSSETQGEEGSHALTAEEVEALTGKTLAGGSTLETTGCAVMIAYFYEVDDSTQDTDALQEALSAWFEGNGYVPVVTSGEGDRVYALIPDGETGYTAPILGETDSLKPSVLSEGSRRFALRNILLPPMRGGSEWQVVSVEEQDYYEEDGVQYPCYYVILSE